jgi:hypothetical protein
MAKKIINILLLFFLFTPLFASGAKERQARLRLEKSNIHTVPLGSGLVSDYVFIDSDLVIVAVGSTLIEVSISTGNQKPIPKPMHLAERRIEDINRFTYDKKKNAIHMILQEKKENRAVY